MRLDNKAAILAERFAGHNVRPHTEGGEEGGDAGEPVPARDYKLTGITLTKNQFESIVGENSFESFFNQTKNAPLEPAFSSFKQIWLDDTYKNCAVTFGLGNTNTREVEVKGGAKIKNLSVKFPKACNERACAELSCTVTVSLPRTLAAMDLDQYGGKEIRVSLRFGSLDESAKDADDDKQGDLVKEAEEKAGKGDAPVDKTRVLAPGQAEREADAARQIGEALRGLEKGEDKKAGKQTPSGSRVN